MFNDLVTGARLRASGALKCYEASLYLALLFAAAVDPRRVVDCHRNAVEITLKHPDGKRQNQDELPQHHTGNRVEQPQGKYD